MFISSTSLNYWGGAYQQAYRPVQRQQTVQTSIWSNARPSRYNSFFDMESPYEFIGANNGVKNVRYDDPRDSFAPINEVMTAPFGANIDMLASNRNQSNPFETNSFRSTSIFADRPAHTHRHNHEESLDNASHRRKITTTTTTIKRSSNNFLSLTGPQSSNRRTNVFRTTSVNTNTLDNAITKENVTRIGNFGSLVRKDSAHKVNHSNRTRVSA